MFLNYADDMIFFSNVLLCSKCKINRTEEIIAYSNCRIAAL